jgi:predicted metal-binding membrane protein
MEVERALADLAEVRDRLASLQEFRGYSGQAAALSGAVAVAAGVVQWILAPQPRDPVDIHRYLTIWFICLVAALAINYGALLVWYARNAALHERRQTRTVGIAILPAIGLGAVLSYAMIVHGLFALLPGVWYLSYAIGLFASRAMLPRGVIYVACAFGLAGAALILGGDGALPLSFWVMPAGFGLGQIVIGYLLSLDRKAQPSS